MTLVVDSGHEGNEGNCCGLYGPFDKLGAGFLMRRLLSWGRLQGRAVALGAYWHNLELPRLGCRIEGPHIYRVFEIIGFDRVIPIHPDVDTALAAIEGQSL